MRGLCFVNVTWCMGEIYRHIAPYIGAEILDWSSSPAGHVFDQFDWILAEAGEGTKYLVDHYKVPRHKVYAVSHDEEDSLRFLRYDGDSNIKRYAGYAVVSDTLACSSLSMGITRVPTVLRCGVDCAFYDAPVPKELRTVGYAAIFRRPNEFGVERKRGDLVRIATERAELVFKPAMGSPEATSSLHPSATSTEKMPDYYRSVDAVIMSSLQEGGGMPPMEAAAAGRLVIGTPVGEFPRLAYEGLGILAPLNADAFVDFVVDQLNFYKNHPEEFNSRCLAGKESARKRDWSCVAQDWIKFVQ